MPKKPIDYSKTIIYKFVCKDLSVKDLYVGHTTNWRQRKSMHNHHCNNSNSKKYNLKVYKTIRENGNWNNWDMIEIEKYPCNDDQTARSRERYWYEQLYTSMNTNRPLRTEEDEKQYQQNRDRTEYLSLSEVIEHKKEYNKKYREKNKKKLKEKNKEYYQNNKEQISEKRKEKYQKNKEQIREKRKEQYTCSCGITLTKTKKSRHEKSKKHINYANSL